MEKVIRVNMIFRGDTEDEPIDLGSCFYEITKAEIENIKNSEEDEVLILKVGNFFVDFVLEMRGKREFNHIWWPALEERATVFIEGGSNLGVSFRYDRDELLRHKKTHEYGLAILEAVCNLMSKE